MTRRYLNPPGLPSTQEYGFSQAVAVSGGRTVYLSGQVAWDEAGQIIGGDDLGRQMQQALRNVATAVESAGGSLADVVAMRIYIVADKMAEGRRISDALKAFFTSGRLPATTWIGVASLAREEFLVEVEAVAVV